MALIPLYPYQVEGLLKITIQRCNAHYTNIFSKLRFTLKIKHVSIS